MFTFVFVAVCFSSSTSAKSIWSISIDEGPAPPPDKEPAFSAHAIRDPRKLAATVVGIVFAYLATALVIGLLLVTVGRPLRKRAMCPHSQSSTEMTKPARQIFQSPVSPAVDQRPWYSPRKLASRASNIHSVKSGQSPGLRSTTSFDMQVLEFDKHKRQIELERVYAAVLDRDEALSGNADLAEDSENEVQTEHHVPKSEGKLPRLAVDVRRPQFSREDLHSRQSPVSPIGRHTPTSPSSQWSPVRAIYPPDAFLPSIRPSTGSPIRAEYPEYPLNTSPYNHQPLTAFHSPLTPRASPRTPKDSPSRRPRNPLQKLNMQALTRASPEEEEETSSATPLASQLQHEPVSTPLSDRPARHLHDEALDRPTALPSIRSATSLPLRGPGPASPGLVRTTYLDARQPRTGMPTPYSPYMPFSPMTPVTPRLVGRREGKMLRKEEAKTGGELVRSKGELWG